MSCHKLRLISWMMMASDEERNALKLMIQPHDNLEGICGELRDSTPRYTIKQNRSHSYGSSGQT
jgi:hypothetical protein